MANHDYETPEELHVNPGPPSYAMSIVNQQTAPKPTPIGLGLSPNTVKNANRDPSAIPMCQVFLIIIVSFIIGIVVGGAISYLLATREAGESSTCKILGKACNPAESCEQIKEAQDTESEWYASGWYYVQGGFEMVYCDMESFGGGWARFGTDNMKSHWNFVAEDQETTSINIISDSDLLKMKKLNFTEFRVFTDVEFRLQADNSINPSFISAVLLPDLTPREIHIIGAPDHTRVLFDEEDDQLECFSEVASHSCGSGGLPSLGTKSQQLFFKAAFFGPRGTGASAHENQWRRNSYTWRGNYYFILAK